MAPKFVQFVRSVEGRLVGRWDAGPYHYFGARVGTETERADDKPIVWDVESVIPLTQQFCIRFSRELARAIRMGDLKRATEDEYAAWLKLEEKRETDAEQGRKVDAAQASPPPAAGAPAPAGTAAPPEPPPDPPPAADAPVETKSEKRK